MSENQEPIMSPPQLDVESPGQEKNRSFVQKAVGLTAEFLFPLKYYLPEKSPKWFGPPPQTEEIRAKAAAKMGVFLDISRYIVTTLAPIDANPNMIGKMHVADWIALGVLEFAPGALRIAYKNRKVREVSEKTGDIVGRTMHDIAIRGVNKAVDLLMGSKNPPKK